MFFRILLVSILTWSMSRCEPPVNSYLPPSSGNSRPPAQYGPPESNGRGAASSPGRGLSGQNQPNSLQNGGKSSTPNSQYGPPSSGFNQQPGSSSNGGLSQNGYNQNQALSQPSSQYVPSTPSQFGRSQSGASERLTSNNQGTGQSSARSQQPETSYGPPPTGDFQSQKGGSSGRYTNNQQGSQDFSSPSNGYQSQGGTPSALYGAPGFGNNGDGARSGQLRNQNGNFDGEGSNEPAKYEFSYEVDDEQTGTKFGHSEQRDGDLATGEYNVVLPDGRKQVVEYEAGLQGYKPQIRYEGSVNGQGGRQGFQQEGSNGLVGGVNNNGFSSQNGSPARYQEASSFADADGSQEEGYPRGGPGGTGSNSIGGHGFGSSGFGLSGSSSGRGGQNFNQAGTNGYPSGGPQNGGSFTPQNSPNSRGGSGYPSGGPQNGGGFSNGDEAGYPSGGPSGARGSGY